MKRPLLSIVWGIDAGQYPPRGRSNPRSVPSNDEAPRAGGAPRDLR
jgi:hypothetical protein